MSFRRDRVAVLRGVERTGSGDDGEWDGGGDGDTARDRDGEDVRGTAGMANSLEVKAETEVEVGRAEGRGSAVEVGPWGGRSAEDRSRGGGVM